MLTAVGKQGLVFRICFSGRTLSKYGKVHPINYYGANDNRGGMEDRLVSDINLIPFSDFDYVDVLLPRGLSTTDYQRKLIKAVSERVRCFVFVLVGGRYRSMVRCILLIIMGRMTIEVRWKIGWRDYEDN